MSPVFREKKSATTFGGRGKRDKPLKNARETNERFMKRN